MKVKTSIALEDVLIDRIDRALEPDESRSAFFERAARELLTARARAKRDARDAEIIGRNAEAMNAEAFEQFEFVNDVFEAHAPERA